MSRFRAIELPLIRDLFDRGAAPRAGKGDWTEVARIGIPALLLTVGDVSSGLRRLLGPWPWLVLVAEVLTYPLLFAFAVHVVTSSVRSPGPSGFQLRQAKSFTYKYDKIPRYLAKVTLPILAYVSISRAAQVISIEQGIHGTSVAGFLCDRRTGAPLDRETIRLVAPTGILQVDVLPPDDRGFFVVGGPVRSLFRQLQGEVVTGRCPGVRFALDGPDARARSGCPASQDLSDETALLWFLDCEQK